MKKIIILVALLLFVFGCFDRPNAPPYTYSQIVDSYTSELAYMHNSCKDLLNELNNLERRESKLQKQRMKISKFFGWNINADKLVGVRARKEAIMKVITKKDCYAHSSAQPNPLLLPEN